MRFELATIAAGVDDAATRLRAYDGPNTPEFLGALNDLVRKKKAELVVSESLESKDFDKFQTKKWPR